MFEELFQRFPGLQNLYENAVANGYTGDPQQLLKEYGQDFQQNIGGLGSVLGVPTPPVAPPDFSALNDTPAGRQRGMGSYPVMPNPNDPRYLPPEAMPMPSSMVDPTVMAYQRGLLSGTVQPQNPYGFGLATSPYYGYPRNPYGSLLY